MNELRHYGIKGQKWGVRRYQYADGTRTPAGKKRYSESSNKTSLMNPKVKYLINSARTVATGKQYVDGYLKKGTTFSRIQTHENFEKFAFYAAYKKHDVNEYLGLFGGNLKYYADKEAKQAEKKAQETGSEADIANAKALREKANNTKVYQLKIEATKKLKIPSDENVSDITANLLKEKEFKQNLEASIADARTKMLRPSYQTLFNRAERSLKRDPDTLSPSEKLSIYKAFNLSLVNHNPQEIAAQNRFYGELKKKGYNAILDYNDKEYSSYHAKRPMIVFDTDSVRLQSVTETNPKVVARLKTRYNAERVAKTIVADTVGFVGKYASMRVSDCYSYVDRKMDDYLNG